MRLSDVIVATEAVGRDVGWPSASRFNLRFARSRGLVSAMDPLKGCGVYMISSNSTGEVIYVGMYRPSDGKIVQDRWGRHLQTITARGVNIGLGGAKNPERRLRSLLDAVDADGLREAFHNSYSFSPTERFRDTGYCTTANRLRYASENWEQFGAATPATVLSHFSFWLFRIQMHRTAGEAARSVKGVEPRLLDAHKPICSKEIRHARDSGARAGNTVGALISSIESTVVAVTGEAPTDLVKLAG